MHVQFRDIEKLELRDLEDIAKIVVSAQSGGNLNHATMMAEELQKRVAMHEAGLGETRFLTTATIGKKSKPNAVPHGIMLTEIEFSGMFAKSAAQLDMIAPQLTTMMNRQTRMLGLQKPKAGVIKMLEIRGDVKESGKLRQMFLTRAAQGFGRMGLKEMYARIPDWAGEAEMVCKQLGADHLGAEPSRVDGRPINIFGWPDARALGLGQT